MKPVRAIAVCLAAVLVAAALFLAGKQDAHREDAPRDVEALAPYARDHDLLNERQKHEARETGRAAFYDNGVLCILEDVPEEYYEKESDHEDRS